MLNWGALCFGLVVGWITYRTMRRTETSGLSDIATVIGAVGGAAVLSLFPAQTDAFGVYSIGLAIGFFAYLIVAGVVEVKAAKNSALKPINRWLGGDPYETTPTARGRSGGNPGA